METFNDQPKPLSYFFKKGTKEWNNDDNKVRKNLQLLYRRFYLLLRKLLIKTSRCEVFRPTLSNKEIFSEMFPVMWSQCFNKDGENRFGSLHQYDMQTLD